MPRGDRTGPRGMGSMTGRGAGFCAGFAMPGSANSMPGRGCGLGSGRGRGDWSRGYGGGGRGMRNRFTAGVRPGWTRFGGLAAPVADPDPQLEKQALKSQADYLQGELDAIRKRLEEIDSKDGQE